MKERIDRNNLPKHVAVIMDGNGRWAKQQGAMRIFGHQEGIRAVREITEAAAEIGIKHLTLYTFSTENWNRPKAEVDGIMTLLIKTIRKEVPILLKNNVRLGMIGDLSQLPKSCQVEMQEAIALTRDNTGLNLILALNYSGKWDILQASKRIAQALKEGKIDLEDIDENRFNNALATEGIADVDLMIRTGGDHRISNYLLWQLAYAELQFSDIFWPEFRKHHLYEAILTYQNKERRFGLISEQVQK